MKKISTLIIFVFLLLGCEKDEEIISYDKIEEEIIGYDKIELETYIIENYSYDAKQLYFNEIFQDSTHANFNDPVLDSDEINNILKVIQAVYNSISLERDTVFDIYQIHGYYCYSFNSIMLRVKTELLEIQNLSNGIFQTGESSLDNLLSTYSFDSVKTSYSYPNFPWLTIYTKNEYNMIPIEKEFTDIKSIEIADFSKGCIGDGNNIALTRDNTSAIITFSIGSGDCPAGCIYHKYWEFEVKEGKAVFIRTY